MKTNEPFSFQQFLDFFPEIELPMILGEEDHHFFCLLYTALPDKMIRRFILPIEACPENEFSEHIACFKIPDTKDFHAIVYWKAELMNYQYILITFDNKGTLIDKRIIAGTFSDGSVLTTSIATIETDWLIYIASGQVADTKEYDATSSTAYTLELLKDGKIRTD